MRLSQVSFAVLALTLFATGCSDPKAPSEANFRKVIVAQLASHPRCTIGLLGNSKVGSVITLPPHALSEEYEDLQVAGAVSIKEIPEPPHHQYGPGTWHEMTILDSGIWQDGKGFCYGNRVLDKIVRWTEPTAVQGVTVSEVTYHWKLQHAKWVPDRFLKAHYDKAEDDDKIALILNSDGWQVVPSGLF